MTFHGSFFYFAERYGLDRGGGGRAPARPGALAALRGPGAWTRSGASGAAAIFTEPQLDPGPARLIAARGGPAPLRAGSRSGAARGPRATRPCCARTRPSSTRRCDDAPPRAPAASRPSGGGPGRGGRGAPHPRRGVAAGASGRSSSACCGPNGGGKTTLLKAVLGLLPVAPGRIEVLGEPPERGRRRVGYLPQRKAFAQTFPATAADLIVAARRGAWPLRVRDDEREAARAALRRVGRRGIFSTRPCPRSREARPSACSSPGPSSPRPSCCSSTSPPRGSMPAAGPSSSPSWPRSRASGKLAAVLVTHNLAAVRRLADRVLYLDHTGRGRGLRRRRPGRRGPRLGGLATTTPRRRAVCEED